MGKENFEDFINPQEEKEMTDGVIEEYANEGIEEFESRMKLDSPATRVYNFRAYLRLVVEELQKDSGALESSPYVKAVYEGIEKRARHDKDPNIRKEAQDTLNQINDLVNN